MVLDIYRFRADFAKGVLAIGVGDVAYRGHGAGLARFAFATREEKNRQFQNTSREESFRCALEILNKCGPKAKARK